MKVAIVHDYLNQYGGGERVVEAMAEVWPDSFIYTSIYNEELMRDWLKINKKRIRTNFIQRLPASKYLSKHYFFAYPFAFRLQDIGNPDVIISSSSYAAKFSHQGKNSLNICYLHTPPRFLWGYDTELQRYYHKPFDRYLSPIYNLLVPPAKNLLRKMDFDAAQEVDFFLTNSKEVLERTKKHYSKDAKVIYPPVDVKKFKIQNSKFKNKDENYFLVVSRLGGYKKIDIAVEAFNKVGFKLKIVGVGPQLDYLKSIAKGNIDFLSRVSDEEVEKLLLNCTALVFPTHEDFGIVPVEAMAAGKSVIAYRGGGALETVVEGVTGEFFDEQTSESLINKLKKFDPSRYNARDCRVQANKFSKDEFKRKIKTFVEEAWSNQK